MKINFTVATGVYRLISSGTLMTIDNLPINVTVEIAGEKTVCVVLSFHPEKHPDGKSMLRRVSEDGSVDKWDIYESDDGDYGWTIKPVPILCYEDGDVMRTLCLQIHTQKISVDGTVKLTMLGLRGSKVSRGSACVDEVNPCQNQGATNIYSLLEELAGHYQCEIL